MAFLYREKNYFKLLSRVFLSLFLMAGLFLTSPTVNPGEAHMGGMAVSPFSGHKHALAVKKGGSAHCPLHQHILNEPCPHSHFKAKDKKRKCQIAPACAGSQSRPLAVFNGFDGPLSLSEDSSLLPALTGAEPVHLKFLTYPSPIPESLKHPPRFL